VSPDRDTPPFRVEVRGQDGCIGISEWTVEGEFRRLDDAHELARDIACRSAREIRIVGPTGAVHYHRAQQPVGPGPFVRRQ